MKTRRYAVLGYPLGHTMSPFIHETFCHSRRERCL